MAVTTLKAPAMFLPRKQTRAAWPPQSGALALALLNGLLEWAALSRSRARDLWSAARGGFSHR
jgi:hypothetical protein